MADFVSGFWNAYVMVLVFLSIAFCVFVLVSNNKARTPGPVGLHDHIWDETLQEYNSPLPRWWMYMFWITIIFAISYLAMYPGFGNNLGKRGWSSGGQGGGGQRSAQGLRCADGRGPRPGPHRCRAPAAGPPAAHRAGPR